ncbi:MAG: NAD(P)-dependent oxidoreductase [Luteolibacter sp.]
MSLRKNPVAVLGLGIIGSRVVERLTEAGWRVKSWNRTPKGGEGGCSTPEEAVSGASVISLFLKDVSAVREVAGRLLPHLKPGQIVLNHSTIDRETTLWLDAVISEKSGRFLDAPFTGSKDASETGKLLYYLGGDAALIAEVTPFLEASSRMLLPCGAVGDATVVKLAMNLVSACTVQALAEAVAISTRLGVEKDVFAAAAANSAFASPLAALKLPGMLAGNFEIFFSMANMAKDSRYALALADQAGLDVPAIRTVSERMLGLCASGLADADFSALVKPYLDEA